MPSSSNDLIDVALKSAFKSRSNEGENSEQTLLEQLSVSSKQILLNTVEFEQTSQNQRFNVVPTKNKHVILSWKRKGEKILKSNMAQKNEDILEDPSVILWSPEKVTLGWKKNYLPGTGMSNLGNTCYLNSSLQALFHIPAMANWLMDEMGSHVERCESNQQVVAFCSICAMMRTLKSSLDRCNNVIKPSFIHNKLKCIGKTLMYGRQEDAHEFIKLLIDHMEKSYLTFRRAHKLDYRSKETTPLNQIFGGYLRQQVICPLCRYVSTIFSHFQDLVLDIRSVGSVDEALNLYFRKETLDSDNAYKCENCHKKVPATKRHLIERAPYVLLLQLKRFTISGGKITKHVNIQKNIDLSRYINGVRQSKEDGSYLYRLVSMVIHIGGSQHGGHYTAIAQTSNGIMFEYDDSSVHSIPLQSALLRNPYILFYEMVRKPKDIPCVKQVIRQSSEKMLLNQRLCDPISKSLPTSRSTSSMVNGMLTHKGESSQDLRKGLYQVTKSPLPGQKERERIVFGIKTHSPNGNNSKDNKSKLVKKPNSNGNSNSSPVRTKNFSWSRSGAPVNSSSSLVPCSEDSESEDETLTIGISNGHTYAALPKYNSSNTKGSNKKLNSDDKSDGAGCSDTAKNNFTFLPRSLQKTSRNSSPKSPTKKGFPNSQSTELDSKNGESSIASKNNDCSRMNSSSPANSKSNSHNECLPGCSSESNHVNIPSQTSFIQKLPQNGNVLTNDVAHDSFQSSSKLRVDGVAVTIRSKLESQKSLSQESGTDKSETESVESKFSQESNRSDKSSRSMKKSLFSLLPCVSSTTTSPDLSPEGEDHTLSSENHAQTNGLDKDKMSPPDSEDSEGSKRDREPEDQSPLSPSKKSKPEGQSKTNDGAGLNKIRYAYTDSEKRCEALSKIRFAYTDHREESSPTKGDEKAFHKDKRKKKTFVNPTTNIDAIPSKSPPLSNSSTGEENFSMEEKKSRHKLKKMPDLANGCSEPVVIEWNRRLNESKSHINGNKECKYKPVFEGNSSSRAVDTLLSSSNLCFGSRVHTWNDESSALDKEVKDERQTSLKRTADELYNEEIDSGKIPKKRHKNYFAHHRSGNTFQRYKPYNKSFKNNNNNRNNNYNYEWNNYGHRANRYHYHH